MRKLIPLNDFTTLGLSAPLLEALAQEGFTTPTPIQTQAIPNVLAGTDVLGIAQTGTGKTAAFALPILHRLEMNPRPAPRKGCRVLVLSPTRELATQIADTFRKFGRGFGIKVAVVVGGVSYGPQVQALSKGVDVLVATPGRLLDHVSQRTAVLSGTEILVLDEVDQMLDLGFVKPIRRIVGEMSARRQNLFFSATMPREIAALADEFLNNPVKVYVAPVATTAERVNQQVIHIEANRKRALLAELLADPAMSRTLVFTRTKRGADKVAKFLEGKGISVSAIHGNKSQNQRQHALDSFRKAKIRVLVATDIAARGIDVDLVTHVVNFELPEVPEAYVHRIGRTARAGASGIAISLCDREERDLLRGIERLTRQSIPAENRTGDATLEADLTKSGGGGRRPEPRKAAHGGNQNRNGQQSRSNRGDAPRTDRADRADHKVRADRTDRTARTDREVRKNHTDRRNHEDRTERTSGAHRAARADRAAHTDRAARATSAEHANGEQQAQASQWRRPRPNSGRPAADKTADRPHAKRDHHDRAHHERSHHARQNGERARDADRRDAGHTSGIGAVAFVANKASSHNAKTNGGQKGSNRSGDRPPRRPGHHNGPARTGGRNDAKFVAKGS